MFTGRLREEIPHALKAIGDAVEDKSTLVELDLSDNAFGPAGADPVSDLLHKNRHIQVLKLNNNGLGISGGKMIASALVRAQEQNETEGRLSSLRVFVAGRNRLENEAITALAGAFEAHGTLEEVRVPQNGIKPEGVCALIKALAACKELQVLDLQDNTVAIEGATLLAETLRCWPKLRHLNLGDTLLTDEGSEAVILALREHSHLEYLNLIYVDISEDTAEKLVGVLKQLPKLKTLELNGNCFSAKGDIVSKLRQSLHHDALGSLSDMDFDESDEEDEAESEDEDVDALASKLESKLGLE
jgi:Ran GTPase-activating protein 1